MQGCASGRARRSGRAGCIPRGLPWPRAQTSAGSHPRHWSVNPGATRGERSELGEALSAAALGSGKQGGAGLPGASKAGERPLRVDPAHGGALPRQLPAGRRAGLSITPPPRQSCVPRAPPGEEAAESRGLGRWPALPDLRGPAPQGGRGVSAGQLLPAALPSPGSPDRKAARPQCLGHPSRGFRAAGSSPDLTRWPSSGGWRLGFW